MATDNWQEEATRMFAEGRTKTEIATRLGKDRSSVIRHLKKVSAEATNVNVKSMEIASLKERLRQLEGEQPRAPVTPVYQESKDESSLANLWKRAEEDNEQRIQAALTKSLFEMKVSGSDPIGFCFASDQHISPGNTVAMKQMRLDAELIAQTDNLYVALGGDGCDNHIKHRSAVLASRSQPDDQWRLFDFYLSIMAAKVAVVISGNHCAWTDQIAGLDILKKIVTEGHKLCYAPYEARIEVTVGKQVYKVAVRHQYRFNSSLNLTHAVKQWFRMGEEVFDIGCICHHHEPAVEAFTGYGMERWACRPGAYQITSGYSRQYGYNFTAPTCPTFVIYPDERRIVGFNSLRNGVAYLKGVLGK